MQLPAIKKKREKRRRNRLWFLVLYILSANLIILIAKPTYLGNLFIVYAIPTAITFSWLNTETKQKILLFAVISILFFAPPIELMARLANSWDVQTSFPKIHDISPVENFLYAFINFIFPLSFYKYFTEHNKKKPLSKNWKLMLILLSILSTVVHLAFTINENWITMHYWQIALIFLVIPALIIFTKNKHIIYKSLPTTFFFVGVFFIHEIVSLEVGHWWWPGEYLLPMTVMGRVFPVDDIIIWYFLSTPVLIGGFEFFFDDFK